MQTAKGAQTDRRLLSRTPARNGRANKAIPNSREKKAGQRPSRQGKNPVRRPPQVCASREVIQPRFQNTGSWTPGLAFVRRYQSTKANPGVQDPVFWNLGWITSRDAHTWGGRLTGFFPCLLGLWPAFFSLLFGIALFALPFLAGVRLSKRLSVWAPLAVCMATIFFAP